jgi:hypothetical protein
MEVVNFYLGWVFLLAGLLAGALIGMFFHGDDWLGGYGTWRRRMVRLAHVSLVGTGLLNLAFALSVRYLGWEHAPGAAAVLFLVGALSMPSVCLLAAWHKPLRHLFAIPVVSLIGAAAIFLVSAMPR